MREAAIPSHLAATSALLIVGLVHLIGQIFTPQSFVTQASQVLIMPALAAMIVTATVPPRSRLVKLGLIALFFAWLGDALPRLLSGDAAFVAMVGAFLLVQVVYIIAFYPYRTRSILSKPILVAPYAAVMIVLLALCFQSAGLLFIPIAVYSVAVLGMAVLATGMRLVGAVGGILFLISGALIALGAVGEVELPGLGFWVMLTYLLGQVLLVHAILRQEEWNTPRPAPPVRAPAPRPLEGSRDTQL